MVTAAQLEANRANALKSTGPRTETGKSNSSQNATTHALTCKGQFIPPGMDEHFHKLDADLRASLKPAGAVQDVIFRRAVDSAWKLERCRFAEELYAIHITGHGTEPMLDPFNADRYAALNKYAREAENSLYKAVRELAKLQNESQFREQVAAAQPEFPQPKAISDVCSLAQIFKDVRTVCQKEAKSTITPPTPRDIHEPGQFPATPAIAPQPLTRAAAA